MPPFLHDWMALIFRWAHVISAITWIGHAFFFNWLDATLDEADDDKQAQDVEGDLWMVHSGGFYEVNKKHTVPPAILERMHWFKWEAALTWITGFSLLGFVYHMGGGLLMVDAGSDISPRVATLIGIGAMMGGWVVYDLIWLSPLGKNMRVGGAVTFGLLIALAFGLTQVMSGRAAYIHVGAVIGTCMVANVWMRIIPAQKALVAAVEQGAHPDPAAGARAKTRSVHNNYITYPLIFIMISNHYYQTYGHEHAWLVLALVMVAGAGVRWLMNKRTMSVVVMLAIVAGASGAMYMTKPAAPANKRAKKTATVAKPTDPSAVDIDPATVGAIRGTVAFDGTPPDNKRLKLEPACMAAHDGEVYDKAVLVEDGKVQNAFVWIKSGLDGWKIPPADESVVVEIDQHGCVYNPRILGMRAGQSVGFVNSDPLLHNIHAIAEENDGFNLAMPPQATKVEREMFAPEVMVHVKCDVHPWMTAYVGVVDHPFFAVTGADGSFAIEGVPPGDYEVGVWHEVLGTQTVTVTVPAQGTGEVAVTLAK